MQPRTRRIAGEAGLAALSITVAILLIRASGDLIAQSAEWMRGTHARACSSDEERAGEHEFVRGCGQPCIEAERLERAEDATAQQAACSSNAGSTLFGRLETRSGSVVRPRAARLSCTGSDGKRIVTPVSPTGEYVLNGLAPGVWRLECEADGMLCETCEVTLDGTSDRVRRDLWVDPLARLVVRLSDPSGSTQLEELARSAPQAIDALRVVVTDVPFGPGRWRAETSGVERARSTDSATPWQRCVLAPDFFADDWCTLFFVAHDPQYATLLLGDRVLDSQKLTTGSTELRLTINAEAVRELLADVEMRFVDPATGSALVQGDVSLAHVGRACSTRPIGSDGRATFHDCVPGACELAVQVPGREHYTKRLVIESSSAIDLGDIRLRPAVQIEGETRDLHGAPRACRVSGYLLDSASGIAGAVERFSSSSNAAGKFVIGGLSPARYIVCCSRDARHEPQNPSADMPSNGVIVDVRRGSCRALELVLGEEAP